MTQIPWLDPLLYKNQLVHSFQKTPGMSILGFVGKAIRDRVDNIDNHNGEPGSKNHYKDFLARFLEIQQTNSDIPPW
jgi:hypothetical protein